MAKRLCWNCGNVADHSSDVTPGVCCQLCGSQDTRLLKQSKPKVIDQLEKKWILFSRLSEHALISGTDGMGSTTVCAMPFASQTEAISYAVGLILEHFEFNPGDGFDQCDTVAEFLNDWQSILTASEYFHVYPLVTQ